MRRVSIIVNVLMAIFSILVFVVFLDRQHMSLQTYGYWGTILGGGLCGGLTLLGVLYTLRSSQRDEDNKRVNQKRLLFAEMKKNQQILQSLYYNYTDVDRQKLRGGVWKALNLEATWIPTDLFFDTYDFYNIMWEFRESKNASRDELRETTKQLLDVSRKIVEELEGKK